jgi:hypothetical protein
LVSSFEVSLAKRKGERMKERRGYWPTSDPIQIEQKLKSLVSLSLQFAWPFFFPFPDSPLEVVVCFVAVDVATLIIDNDNISASVRSLQFSAPASINFIVAASYLSSRRDSRQERIFREQRETHTLVYDMAYIGWAGELLQEEDFAYFLLAFSRFHSMGEFKRKTLNHCPLLLSSWFRERERLQRFLSTLQIYSGGGSISLTPPFVRNDISTYFTSSFGFLIDSPRSERTRMYPTASSISTGCRIQLSTN